MMKKECCRLKENFIELYKISNPLSNDRVPLYYQGEFSAKDDYISFENGKTLDLGTYFNAFSLKKWTKYTTLSKLKIELNLKGKFTVDFYGVNIAEEVKILSLDGENNFSHTFDIEKLQELDENFDMLAIKLIAKENVEFFGGAYFGEFEQINDIHIGITICTFKREKYLLPNLDKLKILTDRNKNFSVMVIDNGNTLEEKNTDSLKILHNPNYGGSGGFTRGIMEQVSGEKATHVLLMDDDVVIELSALDRLYAFLLGLKENYNENFFAGAMLSIEKPLTQTENTGHWTRINGESFGKNFMLTDKKLLCVNEYPTKNKNTFAGWWFCCVPVKAVKKIGYPLPVFIKGDDIEYSVRNNQKILTMNGVAVWHETFKNKLSPAIQYFGDRNMLLLIHLMNNVGKGEFLFAVIARIGRWLYEGSFEGVKMIEYALKDLECGLEKITEIPADKKFQEVREYSLNKNLIASICSSLAIGFRYFFNYEEHDKKVKNFVKDKLQDQKFWREFLKI